MHGESGARRVQLEGRPGGYCGYRGGFSVGDLDFRPTPEVMTVHEMARHLQAAGEGAVGMLLDGEENFATPDFRGG